MSEWNPEAIEKTIESAAKTAEEVAVVSGLVGSAITKLAGMFKWKKGHRLSDPEIIRMVS